MGSLRSKVIDLLQGGYAPGDVAEELGLDVGRGDSSRDPVVLLPGWAVSDGDVEVSYPDATSDLEATQEYVDTGWEGIEESGAICVRAWRVGLRIDDWGDVAEERSGKDSYLIVVHPAEPECREGQDHDWQAPHSIVGGIVENPGVWGGRGCGVTEVRVCLRCGTRRTWSTASQGADSEHDHERISYEERAIGEEDLARYR